MSETAQTAEHAGYMAGLYGPNTENCHFRYFATPELTKAWERGNTRGAAEKPPSSIFEPTN